MFLAGVAAHVHMLVRGPGLAESMSRYLIQRIESTPNVALRTRTRIECARGGQRPRAGAWRHLDTGERETHDIRSLFLMTGADPNSAGSRAAWCSTTRSS